MSLIKVFSFWLLVGCSMLAARAQSSVISGQITDLDNNALIGASIALLNPNDSIFIKGTTSDIDGKFELTANSPSSFLLKFSYVGYEDLFLSKQVSNNQPLLLNTLVLQEKTALLKVVNITGTVIPVQQKGDTTQINADAFKTNKDATAEDLISKMPTITVQDGKVQAQGENVQKVLVDGKDFFGDDASAVLKNLPAEIIDKIQIFDQKSSQSQLTGFDDGNTSKTINIVTKAQFRNGTFGKVQVGYGYEDKWKAGLNLNLFKDKRRITVLFNSNNVNEQNFSSEDLLGVMSSGGGGGGRGKRGGGGGPRGGGGGGMGGFGNDAESFLVDSKNGINTAHSLGLNYANSWKKLDFTSSYFLNYTNNNAQSNLFRQYVSTENTGLTYLEQAIGNSQNTNHRINFKLDWKIDSLNSIVFQPKVSVQQNNGKSTLFGQNTELNTPLSSINSQYKSQLTGINATAALMYRHAFAKKGRTFLLSLTPKYNQNEGDSNLDAYTVFLNDTLNLNDSLRQAGKLNGQGFTFASNVVYTEPLNSKSQLMFNYRTNYSPNQSDKTTLNYGNNSYSLLDTLLSNQFNNEYSSQILGLNYRYQQIKWNITAGLSYQYAQLKGEQLFPDSFSVQKNFHTVLPEVRYQYQFSNKKNLRINYRSNNNAPSTNQLQNVVSNTNPLLLSIGNPNLKQDWQSTLGLRYSSSNAEKSSSFFAFFNAIYTQNYIGNATFIALQDTLIDTQIALAKGSQLAMPININGYVNIRAFNNYSFPLVKLKSNLSVNIGGTYGRTPSQINSQLNYANTYNVGAGMVFSSNISPDVDFTLSTNLNYNYIGNTLQKQLNNSYYNQSSKLKIQISVLKHVVLQTELNHQYNTGLSASYNQNYLLWNAATGYKFLKKQQAEIRLTAFDLLNQNNSINRNTTETYYEDVQTNVLQRYFLLSFIYQIQRFK